MPYKKIDHNKTNGIGLVVYTLLNFTPFNFSKQNYMHCILTSREYFIGGAACHKTLLFRILVCLLSAGHKGAVAAVGVYESVFVSLKYGLRTASQSHLA
jgi:hypothetical protein